ncbi:DUF805 domain-containing protein [candidate division KSB1 bacterium]|nr:DUF805 domain-containing protein [candidate division KSB1 bacterium]
MHSQLSYLFGLQQPVDRKSYFKIGAGLMLVKYLVDASLIFFVTGAFWTPLDYLVPLVSLHEEKMMLFPPWLNISLIIWSLPFLWIGVSMTLRRAVDAGRSPWAALSFFIPILNYLMMLTFCVLPSSPNIVGTAKPSTFNVKTRFKSAVLGIGASILIGMFFIIINVFVLKDYGLALFAATPFVLGVVSAFFFNYQTPRSLLETSHVVTLGLFLVAGALLLFALEGLICLAMAFPLGLIVALLGGVIGRTIALRQPATVKGMTLGVLLLPASAIFDKLNQADFTYEVVSTIEIQASAGKVWQQLIAFNEIENSPDWHFRLGIAYPVHASISGAGVGAVRSCDFSTGSFVEPITIWDETRRLAFDVVAQPPPLQEWSPYQRVYAPHLDGFSRAVRGEFRLTQLASEKTRLEGSTWYRLDIYPHFYWRIFTDKIIHSIHNRVLQQVKKDSESLY